MAYKKWQLVAFSAQVLITEDCDEAQLLEALKFELGQICMAGANNPMLEHDIQCSMIEVKS